MAKPRDNYVIATLLLASFLAVAFTGILMGYVIPAEEHALWGVPHRRWADIHLYFALGLIGFAALHFAMNWQWLVTISRRLALRSVAAWLLVVSLAASLSLYLGVTLAPPRVTIRTRLEFGRHVYFAHQCDDCHAINGVGGLTAPDLAHIGSRRSRAWLRVQITDPKARNRQSKMPAYKLDPKQLNALLDYLASLR